MSREYNLFANLVEVKKGDREDLLSALASLSDFDCDFNGENGIEYAWEETVKKGFESNLEYLLDKVKDIKDDTECINEFFNTWMENDRNYYHDYNVDYLTDENGKIYAIAFSVMAGY
jgi:hypothetical protein